MMRDHLNHKIIRYAARQFNTSHFINEMIPHHEGAIAMAKTTLEYPICSELKTILQAIITSQSNGVRQLKTVLEDITC